MKCHQCSKPAMFHVTDERIPLCLSCHSQFSQLQRAQLEDGERAIHFLSDQMDRTVGFPLAGSPFPPRPKPVQIGDVKHNNINVKNSVVGTINTGTIGTVNQTISALIQLGEPEIAKAIKELTEAVIASRDLEQDQKNKLIEILGTVANEAATPKESRRNSVAKILLEQGTQIITLANDLTGICKNWWPVLLSAFQIVSD